MAFDPLTDMVFVHELPSVTAAPQLNNVKRLAFPQPVASAPEVEFFDPVAAAESVLRQAVTDFDKEVVDDAVSRRVWQLRVDRVVVRPAENFAALRVRDVTSMQLSLATRLRKYNLTLEQYYRFLVAQGGGCATCGVAPLDGSRLCVDHDHACCPEQRSCGKCVRGLLCVSCNWVAGRLEASNASFQAFAHYLKR